MGWGSSARRAMVAGACCAGALLAGCGSSGPPDYSSQQVGATFRKVTGDRLVADPGASQSGIEVLSLDQGGADATVSDARYGTFSIYVVGQGDAKSLYAQDIDGGKLRPGRDGIYWRRLSDSPASWQAAKPYRNVVLQWQAGRDKVAGPGFQRLDAALSSLDPKARRPMLPAEDTPCAQQHIDPQGSGTGTCKQRDQTLVVADRGQRMRLPSYTVSRLTVSVRRAVRSAAVDQEVRAKGRYVALRFRVFNHSDVPLESVGPALQIGRRRYVTDSESQYLLQRRQPFPLQPGDASDVVAVYDVPVTAARAARRDGSLLVIGDADHAAATVDGASVVGWMRLRRKVL